MSNRKIFNFPSAILYPETLATFGYNPDSFGPTSKKWIIARCRYCGKPHKIRKGFYAKSGSACHEACKIEEQKLDSPFKDPTTKAKAESVLLAKYGSTSASQNKIVAQKISFAKKNKKIAKQNKISVFPSNNLISKIDIIKDILAELQKMNMIVLENFAIGNTSVDLFIPDKNFAIDYVVCYEHSEAVLDRKIAQKIHRAKLDICRKNNIRLFTIFEHLWSNRKNQIMNFIDTILGQNKINIAARKCAINNNECKDFLNENHIQGYGTGTIKFFNLEYNGEIVATMTASAHHRQTKANQVVLNRLCFKNGVNVQGGSSRLFKRFVEWAKAEKYDSIISWSDNCYTEGHIYKTLGFDLKNEYGPDYFYWNIAKNTYASKQSKKKSNTGCPSDQKEREWNIGLGYFRVWSCGKCAWEYKL